MNILSISAEVAPFAKTGGLADVCGALPKYIRNLGHDVRVVMPAYQKIEHEYHTTNKYNLESLPGQLWVPTGSGVYPAGVFRGNLPGTDVPAYFIAEWNMFGRSQIYGYSDDAYRFAFFCKAVIELLRALDWRPDIVHAHDWHAAPIITWLATAGTVDQWFRNIPTVFTIHNLAHQGRTNWKIFDYMQLQTFSLAEEGYEEVNFMARGIQHATMINTVSPTYAREIMTPEYGANLDKLLHSRAFDVHGILNGIDTDVWNPATDPYIAHKFDVDTLGDKVFNKRELQARAGLPQRDDIPLIAMVSRLDFQKGLDLTGHAIHNLLNNYGGGEAQFIVLGTGADEYEQMFIRLADYHKDKMRAYMTYDAMLSQLIYAGADMFLMPSRFEPCGLGQMIAMRYGTVPVVRATGGLADTVHDGYTGFTFYDYNSDALWDALYRAVQAYHYDPPRWRNIQQNAMRLDLSWEKSAERYAEIYAWAQARARGWG
ncbi:MAG: glycogen synthase [Anaerolineales bacterium]|nr:glycogen synthase [Anaerolineales bacterium]